MTRRSWIALDARSTRCIVLNCDGKMVHRLTAYELTTARNASAYDLRAEHYTLGPHKLETARRIRQTLRAECCYAFYCKATDSVKLGRTTNIFKRWAHLENQGGRLLQLVAVWQATNCSKHERELHDQFAAHRRIGEWFDAAPILADLRNMCSTVLV